LCESLADKNTYQHSTDPEFGLVFATTEEKLGSPLFANRFANLLVALAVTAAASLSAPGMSVIPFTNSSLLNP